MINYFAYTEAYTADRDLVEDTEELLQLGSEATLGGCSFPGGGLIGLFRSGGNDGGPKRSCWIVSWKKLYRFTKNEHKILPRSI